MKIDAVQAERQPEPPPRTIGRDELNLAEFPITALAHRVPDDCKELVFQDEIRDQSTGDLIPRKLTVTGDTKYGLPTSLDDDVIVALMYITKEYNSFTTRIVPFSRMAVVELLGWARNGQSLRRLDESLHRWLGVTLRYENAWWDKAAQTWVNESFHILDNLTIYDQQTARRIKRNPAQIALPLSTFAWNDVVFRSFQAENLKRLDLSLYFTLSLAPSKRAFRFLDKRFYRSPNLKFDLRSFACGKIGFSQDYSPAKIKEKLQPALDELEGVGFLAPLSRDKRYEKVGHGQWDIVLIRGDERKKPEIEAAAQQPEMPPPVAALVARGVSKDVAEELLALKPVEFIAEKLDIFDWLMEKQDKKAAKNPPGYLVTSIRKDYAIPRGFVSADQRRKQEEARQVGERQAAEERRRAREQDARDKSERQAIAAYRKNLTPDQLRQVEEDALAKVNAEMRNTYDTTGHQEWKRMLLDRITDEHIRRIVQDRPAKP